MELLDRDFKGDFSTWTLLKCDWIVFVGLTNVWIESVCQSLAHISVAAESGYEILFGKQVFFDSVYLVFKV